MKVKCRDYKGYLEKRELTRTNVYGTRFYRVYLSNDTDFIDLRDVILEEIKFIRE